MTVQQPKGFFKSKFNFGRWMGVADLKHNAKSLKTLVQRMTSIQEPEHEETYHEALERLGLSDADVKKRQQQFFVMACVYGILALCVVAYGCHLLWHDHLLSALMCLPILSVLLSFAFREHFWFTQLKHKRLGFTFREWLLTTIGRGA